MVKVRVSWQCSCFGCGCCCFDAWDALEEIEDEDTDDDSDEDDDDDDDDEEIVAAGLKTAAAADNGRLAVAFAFVVFAKSGADFGLGGGGGCCAYVLPLPKIATRFCIVLAFLYLRVARYELIMPPSSSSSSSSLSSHMPLPW